MTLLQRKSLIVSGQVQGVGFRPFVWRLARELELSGHIRNTSAGVEIEIQGCPDRLRDFFRRLAGELPPLARITNLAANELEIRPAEREFTIMPSLAHSGQNVLVSPDMAVCAECLADMRAAGNAREGYPFTNCVNCGPRYTITHALPYDRPATVMKCFSMCRTCAGEYANPEDRRFHAQPIACPQCGPAVWFVDRSALESGRTGPVPENLGEAVERAGAALLEGKILALKGLGGFQLACDARNGDAVARLRQRKNRPHKALAVMAGNSGSARTFCTPDERALQLMNGSQKPIVLCPIRHNARHPLCGLIAPDCSSVGVMLPYTPLHALLFDWLAENASPEPVLVMTSANPAGEPICLGNREALGRLDRLADVWLLHNRDILVRVDDSVASTLAPGPDIPGGEDVPPAIIRRARGYTPAPVPLLTGGQPVLGAGAELKAAFCLTRGHDAFLSQHIGDLKSPAVMDFYRETYAHMQRLLEVRPELIVHDLHPDFLSTAFALELGHKLGIPALALQHHAAHAVSVLAENNISEPALALCLDGSGLGADARIWGGELLYLDLEDPKWIRLGGMEPFLLPGGELAIREPWRIAAALNWQTSGKLDPASGNMAGILQKMLERRLNTPETTSAGRLFDAVAAAIGLCHSISYEGQAAIRLERAASQWLGGNSLAGLVTGRQVEPRSETGGEIIVPSRELFAATVQTWRNTANTPLAAAFFHVNVARSLAGLCRLGAEKTGAGCVGLTGGCMQNALLVRLLAANLKEAGLKPLFHKLVPPGDGGLALGQACWGQLILRRGATAG